MRPRPNGRRSRTLATSLVVVALAWVAGVFLGWPRSTARTAAPPHVEPPANFHLFRDVWEIVNREFYGQKPTSKAVTHGAIRGLIAALDDPFAAFLPADERGAPGTELGPVFADALGVWVEPTPQGALVLAVLPDSPAAATGLRPHDVLLAAGTEAMAGRDRQAVLNLLQGPSGSALVLTARRGSAAPVVVKIKRLRPAPPSSVAKLLEGGVAYLRLGAFDGDLVPAVDRLLPELLGGLPSAMVIDLRDNPGGDPVVLNAVASRLATGILYRERARDGTLTEHPVRANGPAYSLPQRLVVLVNRGTVAEAEILAAALRDGRGARLVGDNTFGQGRLQAVYTLSDSSALRLTVGEWLTPSGQTVDGQGLTPDRRSVITAADVAAGRDRQLHAALDLLGVRSTAASPDARRG